MGVIWEWHVIGLSEPTSTHCWLRPRSAGGRGESDTNAAPPGQGESGGVGDGGVMVEPLSW